MSVQILAAIAVAKKHFRMAVAVLIAVLSGVSYSDNRNVSESITFPHFYFPVYTETNQGHRVKISNLRPYGADFGWAIQAFAYEVVHSADERFLKDVPRFKVYSQHDFERFEQSPCNHSHTPGAYGLPVRPAHGMRSSQPEKLVRVFDGESFLSIYLIDGYCQENSYVNFKFPIEKISAGGLVALKVGDNIEVSKGSISGITKDIDIQTDYRQRVRYKIDEMLDLYKNFGSAFEYYSDSSVNESDAIYLADYSGESSFKPGCVSVENSGGNFGEREFCVKEEKRAEFDGYVDGENEGTCFESGICVKNNVAAAVGRVAQGCIESLKGMCTVNDSFWACETRNPGKCADMRGSYCVKGDLGFKYRDYSNIDFSEGYDDVIEIKDAEERKKVIDDIKKVGEMCKVISEKIINKSDAYEFEVYVSQFMSDCRKAIGLYEIGNDKWKKYWLDFYDNVNGIVGNKALASEWNRLAGECSASNGLSDFHKMANDVVAERERDKRDQIAIEREKQKNDADRLKGERFDTEKNRLALIQAIKGRGYKGYSGAGITSLINTARHGGDISKYKGYVYPVSLIDQQSVRSIQVEKTFVVYSACDLCPTIIVNKVPGVEYVDGQILDPRMMYAFDGVTTYKSILGVSKSAILMTPVDLGKK